MQGLQDFGLDKMGIKEAKELFYNLSYEDLFKHETDPALQGYDRGTVTDSGAVAVDTGKFTGRSPKDKYIIENSLSKNTSGGLTMPPKVPTTNVFPKKPGNISKTFPLNN